MQFAIHTPPSGKNNGFSLVELSIVLVILGLLVGGVLGGRSLIKAAELRSISQEYEQWLIAVNSFKDKYRNIPGDTLDATRFWSGTWNGDGNGRVDDAAAPSTTGEIFTFWQQLALAGLINGDFTGIAGPGGGGPDFYMDSFPGENVPASRYTGGGWSIISVNAGEAYTPDYYNLDYGHMFQVGAKIPGYEMGDPLLTPEDAWNIDRKMDDGEPAKGMVVARYWNDLCAEAIDGSSSATDFEARYRVSDNTARCALTFRKSF